MFVKYLKSLYSPPRQIHVRVYTAGGKGPSYILNKAHRIRGGDSQYQHSFILLDTDVAWSSSMMKTAKARSFELIGNTPCVESIFLTVLRPGTDYSLKSSAECKREFKKNHMPRSNVFALGDCQRLFPKSLLDSRLSRIPPLERLINILQGGLSSTRPSP